MTNQYEGFSCLNCGRPTTHWVDGKPFCPKHNRKVERERIEKYSGASKRGIKGRPECEGDDLY